MSLDDKVGSKVTVDGTARNAAGGAIVMTSDRTPVYVDGLDSWDASANGKSISATGTLQKRGADQTVNAAGEHSHGFSTPRFVLESATWKVT